MTPASEGFGPPGAYRILIVDDDALFARAFGRLMGARGHDVCAVSDAESADVAVRDFRPHAVVCDANLPGVGGVEFLTELGVEWPRVLRVLVSGALTAVRDPVVCELAFGKPWRAGEAEDAIEEALALRRSRRSDV